MRPDEQANRAEIERDQDFRTNMSKGIGTVATLATGAGAASAASRVLPWLSKHIPTELAMKGLNKVSPKIANFLKRGQSMGLDLQEGFQYVKDQITPKEEPATENRNIIEQYSPELHQFIKEKVGAGEDPLQAAAAAIHQKGKHFERIIKMIEKDHNTPWSSIVEGVYGGKKAPNPKEEALKKYTQHKKSLLDQETERFQNAYGQQQPNETGQGQGQAALMDILNKINQRLGQ